MIPHSLPSGKPWVWYDTDHCLSHPAAIKRPVIEKSKLPLALTTTWRHRCMSSHDHLLFLPSLPFPTPSHVSKTRPIRLIPSVLIHFCTDCFVFFLCNPALVFSHVCCFPSGCERTGLLGMHILNYKLLLTFLSQSLSNL